MADKPNYEKGLKARQALLEGHEKEWTELHMTHRKQRADMRERHEKAIRALHEKHASGGKAEKAPIYKGVK